MSAQSSESQRRFSFYIHLRTINTYKCFKANFITRFLISRRVHIFQCRHLQHPSLNLDSQQLMFCKSLKTLRRFSFAIHLGTRDPWECIRANFINILITSRKIRIFQCRRAAVNLRSIFGNPTHVLFFH